MDGLSAMAKVAPDALSRVNAALVAGPASAVDDVDELYAAGLPEGLPGNLHHVASVARAELLEHRARVTLKKRELEAARKLSSEQQAQRQIRRSGAYDKHAPSSSGDAAASADDGAERCDECEDPEEGAVTDPLDDDDPLSDVPSRGTASAAQAAPQYLSRGARIACSTQARALSPARPALLAYHAPSSP